MLQAVSEACEDMVTGYGTIGTQDTAGVVGILVMVVIDMHVVCCEIAITEFNAGSVSRLDRDAGSNLPGKDIVTVGSGTDSIRGVVVHGYRSYAESAHYRGFDRCCMYVDIDVAVDHV